MRRHHVLLLLAGAVLLILPAAGVQGQPYNFRPLDPGLGWEYLSQTAETWRTSVQGEQEVLGVTTTALLHIVSVPETQYVRNYWTVDVDGNVFLHGAENLSAGFVASYDPPILWLDVPLSVGKTWSTNYQIYYSLDGTNPGDPGMTIMLVEDEADVTVPLGTYHCFGVSHEEFKAATDKEGRTYNLLGFAIRSLDKRESNKALLEWFSDGTGQVQMDFLGELFGLTKFGPVLVRASTWGGVKNLYH